MNATILWRREDWFHVMIPWDDRKSPELWMAFKMTVPTPSWWLWGSMGHREPSDCGIWSGFISFWFSRIYPLTMQSWKYSGILHLETCILDIFRTIRSWRRLKPRVRRIQIISWGVSQYMLRVQTWKWQQRRTLLLFHSCGFCMCD